MSLNDDISKIFQQNQHKLDQLPPPSAWRRLDDRLARRPKYNPFQWVKYVAAASLLFGIVASIFVLGKLDLNRRQEAQKTDTEQVVAPATTDSNLIAMEEAPVAESTHDVKSEGPMLKQSVGPARVEPSIVSKNMDIITENLSINDDAVMGYSDAVPERMEVTAPSATYFNKDYTDNYKISESVDAVPFSKPQASGAPVAPANRTLPGVSAEYENDYVYDESTQPKAKWLEEGVNPLPEKKIAVSKEKSSRAKKDYISNSNSNVPVIASSERMAQPNSLLQPFLWLQGTWKDDGMEGDSKERWFMLDPNTLEGEAAYLLKGDTLFTERLTIQVIGSEVFFISPIDHLNRRLKYKLVSLQNDIAVFEQQYVPNVPNQVLLIKTGNKSFSLEMKNVDGNLTNDQIQYMNNRNRAFRDHSVRYLRKE